MIRHSFPKLSLALFKKLNRKQYKITPVPTKPTKGFGDYLDKPSSIPLWRVRVSKIAKARKKARYG